MTSMRCRRRCGPWCMINSEWKERLDWARYLMAGAAELVGLDPRVSARWVQAASAMHAVCSARREAAANTLRPRRLELSSRALLDGLPVGWQGRQLVAKKSLDFGGRWLTERRKTPAFLGTSRSLERTAPERRTKKWLLMPCRGRSLPAHAGTQPGDRLQGLWRRSRSPQVHRIGALCPSASWAT